MLSILILGLAALLAIALSMIVPTPIIKGLTTISWGTSGSVGTPTGCIIQGLSITPKNAGIIDEVENSDTAGVAYVLLDDGFTAQATLTYDTAKTWPAVGDAVVLTLPKIGAVGGTTTYSCSVTSMPPELARKQAATIKMGLIFRPGVTA
jgi:hypothetical protein